MVLLASEFCKLNSKMDDSDRSKLFDHHGSLFLIMIILSNASISKATYELFAFKQNKSLANTAVLMRHPA